MDRAKLKRLASFEGSVRVDASELRELLAAARERDAYKRVYEAQLRELDDRAARSRQYMTEAVTSKNTAMYEDRALSAEGLAEELRAMLNAALATPEEAK